MSEWVGLQPLRVQALMTKLQAEKSQLADLEGRVLSIQNNLSWQITARGDVADALQRARNKIRRRGELLAELEGVLRNAVDSFDATDKKRSDSKNALSYWSAVTAGGGAWAAGLGSLAMSCGDRLFDKFGSIFGTGTGGASTAIVFNDFLHSRQGGNVSGLDFGGVGSVLKSTMSSFPEETVLGTPAPFQENKLYEQILRGKGELWGYSEKHAMKNINREELLAYAKAKGLSGEKPVAGLLLEDKELFEAQYNAWRSTFTDEEWAEYQAEKAAKRAAREAEKEANKPLYEKVYDKLRDTNEGVAKAAKNFKKDAEEKLEAAGKWVGEKVEGGVEWAGNKAEEIATGVKEGVGELKEDWKEFKTDAKENIEEVTQNVNNFLDEHPKIRYTVDAIEGGAGVVGGVISGAGAIATGNYAKAVSCGYGAWNSFIDMEYSMGAFGNRLAGDFFKKIGNDDEAAFWYGLETEYAEIDGVADALESVGGESLAGIARGLDYTNGIYAGVTGLGSVFSGISNASNGAEAIKTLFNWKTSDGSVFSNYDSSISNFGNIVAGGRAILEGEGLDFFSSIFAPVKGAKKIGGAPVTLIEEMYGE